MPVNVVLYFIIVIITQTERSLPQSLVNTKLLALLRSTDHHQHRPDVLCRASGSGRAQRSHRRLPDGAEVVAHERLLHQSQQLHLLQQEGDSWKRKLHQHRVISNRRTWL